MTGLISMHQEPVEIEEAGCGFTKHNISCNKDLEAAVVCGY